ncbi:SAM-dependent methyltransferase [Nocardia terpenica]|nr:SAM-dependent methyltransferase [Nocardia terpenica]MBF6108945.1 SAM-dependent methyltransferase [Nocardia terpenica]MBF6121788.1 SAM-dependent methyltransferase [Nocardia terpenica]
MLAAIAGFIVAGDVQARKIVVRVRIRITGRIGRGGGRVVSPRRIGQFGVGRGTVAEARIVYEDKDPLALALMASAPQGKTVFIRGDLHDPESILVDPSAPDPADRSAGRWCGPGSTDRRCGAESAVSAEPSKPAFLIVSSFLLDRGFDRN